MVAAVEGHHRLVRDEIGKLSRLREDFARWPAARGLGMWSDAVIDGAAPPIVLDNELLGASSRAIGEYALDLAMGHLAVGNVDEALSLFEVGLDYSPWPYHWRGEVCGSALDAAAASHEAEVSADRFTTALQSILGSESADATESRSVTEARLHAVLVASIPQHPDERARTAIKSYGRALARARRSGAMPQRIRVQVSYALQLMQLGQQAKADKLLSQASGAARFAAMGGWAKGIEKLGQPAVGAPKDVWISLDTSARSLVQMAVDGATNSAMANALFVSERTVVNRLRGVYRHLGVESRRGLISLIEQGRPSWLSKDK